MPSREKLAEFAAWCQKHITGEKEPGANLDRLFQAFGQGVVLDEAGQID